MPGLPISHIDSELVHDHHLGVLVEDVQLAQIQSNLNAGF